MTPFFQTPQGHGPISRNIGRALRARREAAQLSQRGLALQCGLSRMEIHYIEKGARCPRLDTLEILCRGLDILLLELVAEADRHGRAEG